MGVAGEQRDRRTVGEQRDGKSTGEKSKLKMLP